MYWVIYTIKRECIVNSKIWDERLINLVSYLDAACMICEAILNKTRIKMFKLIIEKNYNVCITMKIANI